MYFQCATFCVLYFFFFTGLLNSIHYMLNQMYRLTFWCSYFAYIYRIYSTSSTKTQNSKIFLREATVSQRYHWCKTLWGLQTPVLSFGKCFTAEALLAFFSMEPKGDCIKRNRPPYYILEESDNRKQYYDCVSWIYWSVPYKFSKWWWQRRTQSYYLRLC